MSERRERWWVTVEEVTTRRVEVYAEGPEEAVKVAEDPARWLTHVDEGTKAPKAVSSARLSR